MKPFLPTALRQADFVRTVYHIEVDAAATLDDITEPANWVHLQKALKLHDRVEVVAKDGSWFADVLVTAAPSGQSQTFRVAVLFKVNLSAFDPAQIINAAPSFARPTAGVPDGYAVNHTPKTRWRVVRAADGETLIRDLPTRDDAVAWLAENVAA